MELFWETNNPSSTKEIKEIGIFRFFRCFSREWKTEERYKAESIGDRAEPFPTPTLKLKEGEIKSFQQYWVFLPTR